MDERDVPSFVPPVKVERLELTHEIRLSVYVKDTEGRHDQQVVSINVDVPAGVADTIVHEVHKVLAAASSPLLALPLLIPNPLKEEDDE